MIGQVIEGLYQGSSVYRHPEKNVLYIQTQEGKKIALSKQNVISIENISDQYPDNHGRVLMVLWNDFETSVLQLGTAELNAKKTAAPESKPIRGEMPRTEKATNRREEPKKKKSLLVPLLSVTVIVLAAIIAVLLLAQRGHEHTWLPADCLNPEKCETCGEIRGEALGHLHGEVENDMVFCARCGEMMMYLGHTVETVPNAETEVPTYATEAPTETVPAEEDIKDLLSIETVKWHKHYINADDYHCDLIVTNNSQYLVEAEFTIKYFDESDNVIGVSNVSTEALAPGASHLLASDNESPYEYTEVTVTMAEVDERYKGSVENVACEDYAVNGEKVIFEVTNNGDAAVSFVSAYVLFYNGDEVVDYDYAYATDDDYELKPGATLMSEISTNKSFTSYRIFYYGRID